jgi:hypothetical protein
MSAVRVQYQKKAVYRRGLVACRKCAAAINVHKLNALPDEFSLHCSNCGDRSIYFKRAIAIQELPERRKKPRRERA